MILDSVYCVWFHHFLCNTSIVITINTFALHQFARIIKVQIIFSETPLYYFKLQYTTQNRKFTVIFALQQTRKYLPPQMIMLKNCGKCFEIFQSQKRCKHFPIRISVRCLFSYRWNLVKLDDVIYDEEF